MFGLVQLFAMQARLHAWSQHTTGAHDRTPATEARKVTESVGRRRHTTHTPIVNKKPIGQLVGSLKKLQKEEEGQWLPYPLMVYNHSMLPIACYSSRQKKKPPFCHFRSFHLIWWNRMKIKPTLDETNFGWNQLDETDQEVWTKKWLSLEHHTLIQTSKILDRRLDSW